MTEENTITIKKDNLWKYSTLVLVAVIIVFGAVSLFNSGNSGTDSQGLPATGQAAASGNSLIENNDPVLGDKNAEVSVLEFSDFQCPFCARAFEGAVRDLKNSDLFREGKVNFVYKHFPLNSIHPYAQKAAEASLCAQDQGKFWEYHDMLFQNQNALDTTSLKSYASQLGLDTGEFSNCLENDEKSSEVSKELRQATSSGGQGTPYFVIVNNNNGRTTSVSGAVPFTQIQSAINSVR